MNREAKTIEEIQELYILAWETKMTPQNADNILEARKKLAEIEQGYLAEISEHEGYHNSRSHKMRRRIGSMVTSAKKFIDNVGDRTRAVLADIEIAQASLEDEVLAVSGVRLDGFMAKAARRDGTRKKALINVDRQAKFTAGAVNFEDRVSSQRRRHQEQTRREAARLSIRAKRVS